jgi:hypothetical protein
MLIISTVCFKSFLIIKILIMKIILALVLAILCVALNATYSEHTSSKMIQLSTAIYDINKVDQSNN